MSKTDSTEHNMIINKLTELIGALSSSNKDVLNAIAKTQSSVITSSDKVDASLERVHSRIDTAEDHLNITNKDLEHTEDAVTNLAAKLSVKLESFDKNINKKLDALNVDNRTLHEDMIGMKMTVNLLRKISYSAFLILTAWILNSVFGLI